LKLKEELAKQVAMKKREKERELNGEKEYAKYL
jgi:hypothetical protein